MAKEADALDKSMRIKHLDFRKQMFADFAKDYNNLDRRMFALAAEVVEFNLSKEVDTLLDEISIFAREEKVVQVTYHEISVVAMNSYNSHSESLVLT